MDYVAHVTQLKFLLTIQLLESKKKKTKQKKAKKTTTNKQTVT